MKNDPIIKYAIALSKTVLWLCYIFFTAFIVMLIHWHFNPEGYGNVDVTNSFKAGFGVSDIKVYTGEKSQKAGEIMFSKLNHIMVYWLLLRASFFFGLTVAIIRRIVHILQSMKDISTFYHANINHFQTMAKYGFIVFFISCFNFSYINGEFDFHFTIAFGPLLFAMACLVLAAVFKEGKRLLEDQNMII